MSQQERRKWIEQDKGRTLKSIGRWTYLDNFYRLTRMTPKPRSGICEKWAQRSLIKKWSDRATTAQKTTPEERTKKRSDRTAATQRTTTEERKFSKEVLSDVRNSLFRLRTFPLIRSKGRPGQLERLAPQSVLVVRPSNITHATVTPSDGRATACWVWENIVRSK